MAGFEVIMYGRFWVSTEGRTIPAGTLARIFDPTYGWAMPERTIPETLKASIEAKLPPLSEEESYVKIGDRVVEFSDPDEPGQ